MARFYWQAEGTVLLIACRPERQPSIEDWQTESGTPGWRTPLQVTSAFTPAPMADTYASQHS